MPRRLLLIALLVGCSQDTATTNDHAVTTDDTGAPSAAADDTSADDTAQDTAPEQLLASDWLSALTITLGCNDTTIIARNADDSVAIVFQAYNLAQAAHAVGAAYTQSYTLPSDSAPIHVYVGERVSDAYCAAHPGGSRVIDAVYEPTSGTAQITVSPDGEPTESGDYPAQADLLLIGLDLSSADHPEQTGSISAFEIWAQVGMQP